MPKFRVKTDQGTFEVELDQEPQSEAQLNSLVTQHLSGGGAAPKTREQLQHEHNLNVEAGKQADPVELSVMGYNTGLRPKEIGAAVRGVSMLGGIPGAVYGEEAAQAIEQAGGEREGYDPLAIAAQAAIPGMVSLAGQVARPIAKSLYGSALKLSSKIKPDKAERILETGLNEGRIATTRSIKKSLGRQKEIEAEIDKVIGQNPNAPINAQSVNKRVDQVADRFESTQPEADRAILQNAKDEFIRNYGIQPAPAQQIGPRTLPRDIPAAQGQHLKKANYRKLGHAAYGELKGAEKESLKAQARGLKEELEVYWPELKGLNESDGALFDLNRALAQAAHRIGNRDVMGIGIPIKMEAFGKPGLILGLLDSPGVKQRLAIVIDKARHLKNADRKLTSAVTRTATLPSAWEE